MASSEQFEKAFALFDSYNSNDPNKEDYNGQSYPKELLYATRMSEKLDSFKPGSPDYLKLAARCGPVMLTTSRPPPVFLARVKVRSLQSLQ